MPTYLGKKWRMTVFYTTQPAGLTIASHEHNVFLNVTDGGSPGAAWDDFVTTTRQGIVVGMTDFLDTYMDLVEPLFAPTAQFIRAELWAAEPNTKDFIFYSTLPIGHAGSSAGASTPYIGQIITYRCQNGKSMRSQFLETVLAAGAKDPYPFTNAQSAALAAYIAGETSSVVNQSFAFPIAPINNCVEQNEALWDARQR